MLIAYGVLEILRFEEQAKSQNNVFVLPTHAFMWFFTVEVVMKWLCMGSAFVRSKFNVFDAVVVIPTTILDIIKMYSGLPAFMETIIAVLRLLRLLRVVRAFREVRVVLRTYVKIFPVYVRYMIVLAMFFYFFGVVGECIRVRFSGPCSQCDCGHVDAGVECYAGTIGKNVRELDPTDCVSLHYTEINFNSMVPLIQTPGICCVIGDVVSFSQWEGLVTLFVFMNLSNWPVIVDALTQTTNEFAWLYFALWYLSITICVLNIVTAFILEDFQLMKAFVEDERRLVPAWKVCDNLC
jgi:Ion transport protein